MNTQTQPEAQRLADYLQTERVTGDCLNAAAELRRQHAHIVELEKAYHDACKLVADMHSAAAGKVIGPIRGVVEDVADLRAERDALQSMLDAVAAACLAAEKIACQCIKGDCNTKQAARKPKKKDPS